MSRTPQLALPLIAVALATACGSPTAEAPDPEPVTVVESPVTTCPAAPDVVLRRSAPTAPTACAGGREARSGHPHPSG